MQLFLLSHIFVILGGFHLMSCLKDVPTLRGDNFTKWRKKVDLAFVCAKVDWVVDTPQPVKPTEPVRGTTNDAAWEKKKRDHAPLEMSSTTKMAECQQKVHGIYQEHN
jgi:hypothetical protein